MVFGPGAESFCSDTLWGMNPASRLVAMSTCAVGLCLPAALTGCSADPTAAAVGSEHRAERPAAPGRVGVENFAAIVATPNVQIIDVRTPEEFSEGHLAGAVNIPVQATDFTERIASLDPAATYAVYCRSGNRSKPAVSAMKGAGIAAVYELDSGTIGWTAGGQPLVR